MAAPEFLRIGVGTGLSILANVAVDKAGIACYDFDSAFVALKNYCHAMVYPVA